MHKAIHITRKEVGDAIKTWRKKNHMSQKEMGAMVGRSGAWIGKLERFPEGYRPYGDSLLQLLIQMGNQVGYARGIVAAVKAPPYCDENLISMRVFDAALDYAFSTACERVGMEPEMEKALRSEFYSVDVTCDD